MGENYPLHQILDVKKRREEAAQKVVEEKKKALDAEEKSLKQLQEARDKVQVHYREKLTQLRQTLDAETDTLTIDRMKQYLKTVQVQLVVEEGRVKEQQKKVDAAAQALTNAQDAWREKRKEVEKLQEHRSLWLKEETRKENFEIEKQMDEIGTTIYYGKKNQPS